MAITAALVKELRERTGAGMMDCKKALVETNADLEAAIDLMRASGAAKAAKKAGRVASEGLVSVTISEDKMHAAILEVNSETDFVTKGSAFIDFVDTLGALALKNKPESVEIFSEQKLDSGVTVDQAREEIIAKIGENISVRRVQIVSTESGVLGAYKHGERIAVLTVLSSNDAELAKDIAMHIAAAKPRAIDQSGVDAELIETERRVAIEKAKEAGKPEDMLEKIATGTVNKFLKEVTLLNQAFVKDDKLSIQDLLKKNNATVHSFTMYSVGEGIEKKQENFAAEVAAASKV